MSKDSSRFSRRTKWLLMTLAVMAGYVLLSCALHHWIFPEPQVGSEHAPRKGTVIENKRAGERIDVTHDRFETNGEYVRIEVTLQPGGAIPEEHVHGNVLETFEGLEGTTTMVVNGKEHPLSPGQAMVVKPGTPHIPINKTRKIARFSVTMKPPGDLDICLLYAHRFLSSGDTAPSGLHRLLQLARFSGAYDIYLAGIPVPLQAMGVWLMEPTLRLLGYKPTIPEEQP